MTVPAEFYRIVLQELTYGQNNWYFLLQEYKIQTDSWETLPKYKYKIGPTSPTIERAALFAFDERMLLIHEQKTQAQKPSATELLKQIATLLKDYLP